MSLPTRPLRPWPALLATAMLVLVTPANPAGGEQPAAPAGTRRVLAGRIDASGAHTCVVLDGGAVRCWGLGIFGQLGYDNDDNVGDGSGANVNAAGPVDLGAGRTATAAAVGGVHTCALLDDGSVRCWGSSFFGQLGYGGEANVGDGIGESVDEAGPVNLGAGRTATAITAGDLHTCALLDNGTVRCWGRGESGRLGYGNPNDIGDDGGETPGNFAPVDLGVGRTATAITAGSAHTCALLDDGTVRCWGVGDDGQLGYGGTADVGDGVGANVDEVGPVDLGTGRTATAITAGGAHSCALLDNARVRCWGSGFVGQLGYGDTESVGDDAGETPGGSGPVDLGAGRTATAVTAGSFHTCALLDNATVRCWGAAFEGQLGYGGVESVGDDAGETPGGFGPVDLGAGRTATAISAGSIHTCAVLDNGTVRCWGEGESGQLGYGNPEDIGNDPGETPGGVGPVDAGGLISVAPGAPIDPSAVLTGAAEITVTWGEPDTGLAPPLEYRVTSDPTLPPVVTSATTATFSGLADGTYTFTVTARNRARSGPPAVSNPVVVGSAAPPGTGDGFVAVSPVRVLDTRVGLGAVGPLAAEATLALSVPGVPAGATAVVVNVTVTEPDRDGFLTVWPCGPARPLVSNLNFAAGENRPNLVVATRGAGGQVCFGGNATAHVVADLFGWYQPVDATTSRYNPLTPERLVDSRTSTRVAPAAPLSVTVVGGPVPADATAVMLNVTAVDPVAPGFLTVWPCDQAQPVVSNVNYTAGQIVPNAVAVKTSPAGTVCVASFVDTDVVVDRVGSFGATGDLYETLDPARVLDTRSGLGASTGKVAAEATLAVTVPGLPADASGVIVNVTATEADGDGFVTVWPCGQPRPLASTLNIAAGQLAVPNLAAVALGPAQQICLSGNTTTHLIADLTGTYHP